MFNERAACSACTRVHCQHPQKRVGFGFVSAISCLGTGCRQLFKALGLDMPLCPEVGARRACVRVSAVYACK